MSLRIVTARSSEPCGPCHTRGGGRRRRRTTRRTARRARAPSPTSRRRSTPTTQLRVPSALGARRPSEREAGITDATASPANARTRSTLNGHGCRSPGDRRDRPRCDLTRLEPEPAAFLPVIGLDARPARVIGRADHTRGGAEVVRSLGSANADRGRREERAPKARRGAGLLADASHASRDDEIAPRRRHSISVERAHSRCPTPACVSPRRSSRRRAGFSTQYELVFARALRAATGAPTSTTFSRRQSPPPRCPVPTQQAAPVNLAALIAASDDAAERRVAAAAADVAGARGAHDGSFRGMPPPARWSRAAVRARSSTGVGEAARSATTPAATAPPTTAAPRIAPATAAEASAASRQDWLALPPEPPEHGQARQPPRGSSNTTSLLARSATQPVRRTGASTPRGQRSRGAAFARCRARSYYIFAAGGGAGEEALSAAADGGVTGRPTRVASSLAATPNSPTSPRHATLGSRRNRSSAPPRGGARAAAASRRAVDSCLRSASWRSS